MKTRTILCAAWLAIAVVQADAQPQAVYRCGNAYSAQPCDGGAALALDDARPSRESAEAARTAARRDARLAEELQRERETREKAASRAVVFRSSRMAEPEAGPSDKSGAKAGKASRKKDFSAVTPGANPRKKN